MKCLLCESLSFFHICRKCQELFLVPSIYKRKILYGVEVISFYRYKDIKNLLHTKHTDLGYYIYNILAKNSFKKFRDEFSVEFEIVSVGIDEYAEHGYSHTAILNKALESKNIKPSFCKLIAKNRVSYSGKSKEFRLLNPREFIYIEFKNRDVILVDDIITTGSTLNQAITTLKSQNKNILFCLTLADASQK